MTKLGTPLTKNATKVLFCGAGELGKEVIIEMQRLGVEVIAVDRYHNAPGMQVAHHTHMIDMLDGKALRAIITQEQPDFIIPEIEAIDTAELLQLESEGYVVVPSARAVNLTMNREGIRRLAAEELGLPTSAYRFADNYQDYLAAVTEIGMPCIVKPVMSSSGKGQSTVKSDGDIDNAWQYAQSGGRAGAGRVIVEGFIDFDYEVTLLTLRHRAISNDVNNEEDEIVTTFCQPIGHRQEDGDYRESWQPQCMTDSALTQAKAIAKAVTDNLGGMGIFGVELFVKRGDGGDDQVFFSEVSPRPHDTGLVTLISQNLSEFALHARALLGLPVPQVRQLGPAASSALLVEGESSAVSFDCLDQAIKEPDTSLRLFGKPSVSGRRRMGVTLALGNDIDQAVDKAVNAKSVIKIKL